MTSTPNMIDRARRRNELVAAEREIRRLIVAAADLPEFATILATLEDLEELALSCRQRFAPRVPRN